MKSIYHWLRKIKAPAEKSKWQIREPVDRTYPVEHEQFIDTRLEASNALLIGASIRGRNHAHHGKWREDAFYVDQTEQFTIMAMADGVGSCPLSRIGADIACHTSVHFIKDYLMQPTFVCKPDTIQKCLEDGLLHTIISIEKEADRRKIEAEEQLATTLLLVLHGLTNSEHLMASLQIGDGIIGIKNGKEDITLLGKPDYGKYAGQSRFLTSSGIKAEISERVSISTSENLRHITLMTDGIGDDFFPPDKELKDFFSQMETSVLNRRKPSDALQKWMRYEKPGSYDDRTLLLLSFY